MPVPGTGTAVWWETQIDPTLVFGIPMVAYIGKEKRPTENLQLEPDIKVPTISNPYLAEKIHNWKELLKKCLKRSKRTRIKKDFNSLGSFQFIKTPA